jgi:hypothetical protein
MRKFSQRLLAATISADHWYHSTILLILCRSTLSIRHLLQLAILDIPAAGLAGSLMIPAAMMNRALPELF